MRLYTFLASLLCVASSMITGCTLSFQNISTHGTATDLVDENQAAQADVSPDISLPVVP